VAARRVARRCAAQAVQKGSGAWDEFREAYFAELDAKPEATRALLEAVRGGAVTLLYAARDSERNNAVALKEYFENRLKQARGRQG
jgi:uncharacterized protein YeaO (DUF488 family)